MIVQLLGFTLEMFFFLMSSQFIPVEKDQDLQTVTSWTLINFMSFMKPSSCTALSLVNPDSQLPLHSNEPVPYMVVHKRKDHIGII